MSILQITITGGDDFARKMIAERIEIALLQMLHTVRVRNVDDHSSSTRFAPQGFDAEAQITIKKEG